MLKILEGEVNLREETRVAEQARPREEDFDASGNPKVAAVPQKEKKDDEQVDADGKADEPKKEPTFKELEDAHISEAIRLSESQDLLRDRTDQVIDRIQQLPEPENFGKEIALLSQVESVMKEAVDILVSPNTGSEAIAAETEAIELLLQCKRINPKAGGGGGGSSPGGGGQGDTQDSALALIGAGVNASEQRRASEVTQATGESGRSLPEEFRAGLDEYFSRWERSK